MPMDPDPWVPPPQTLELEGSQVHVWRVPLRLSSPWMEHLDGTLSEDEHQRAERFHFIKDRDHYIAGRGSLRNILSRYLDISPADLAFSYTEYGKPALKEEQNITNIQFNVSHSLLLALIAVTLNHSIGVDLEYMREELADEKVARRFFSNSEVETLMGLPETLRKEAFFNCWTRKEAYIKARGEGLSLPLDQFDVTLAPGTPAALLSTRPDPQEINRWTMREINPGSGYVGALAVQARKLQLSYWQWPD